MYSSSVPSNIPPAAVQAARDQLTQGNAMAAWETLANAGDRYADNAAAVLGRNGDLADRFFHDLVKNYWEATVGADAYQQKFDDLAQKHLDNYLKELEKGLMPDTQDILTSYEGAARVVDLSPNVAFDGALSRALEGPGWSAIWGTLLGMEGDRVTKSETKNDLTPGQAASLIFDKDNGVMRKTLDQFGKEDLLGGLAASLAAHGLSAYVDFYKDNLNGFHANMLSLIRALSRVGQKFGKAKSIPSPIILDLDGDGVETTGVDTGAYFDHAGEGFAERTGWVGKDDGLLVRDLNGNGRIDTGAELFGSETLLTNGSPAANGFAALAELDANHDGRIDAADPVFGTIRIWKDADGNGYASPGELIGLDAAGVRSINVAYSNSTIVDINGNAHQQVGRYTTTTGVSRAAEDVWFKTDATYSRATSFVPVPADIAALPEAGGYGTVYSLHQAMARDTTGQLKGLVVQFVQNNSAAERDALLTQIIYRWTGVQDIDPGSRSIPFYGNAIGDARKLEALERFMGEKWYGVWCWGTLDPNPHGKAAPVLLKAWEELVEYVNGQLMAQSRLKALFGKIEYKWDQARQSMVGDLTQVTATLTADLAANRTAALQELSEFGRAARALGALDGVDLSGFLASLAPLGQDVLAAFCSPATTMGDDVLSTPNDGLNQYLVGLGGNDVLTTSDGNDVLDGGAGNDTLKGGLGDDTYLMRGGDGRDTIIDAGGQDALRLLDVNPSDVTVARDAASLYLTFGGNGWVEIDGWFVDVANRIERVQFADGSTWVASDLEARVTIPVATSSSDVLYGTEGADTLNGLAGDDVLSGQLGNDTLEGGLGNDLLDGGPGNDLYIFGRGDGQDIIVDTDVTVGNSDTLRFKAGIAPSEVVVTNDRHNLYLAIAGTTDKITVRNWLDSDASKVERIEFADGTVLDVTQSKALIGTPTENADCLVGDATGNTIVGLGGDDQLYGEGGDDMLSGGAGSDALDGGAGNDSLDGGAGGDMLSGGTGNDSYYFGRGFGHDTIVDDEGIDAIRLAPDLTPADVRVRRDPWDLILEIRGSTDALRVTNWFTSDSAKIERAEFADGTVWTTDDLQTLVRTPTEDADILIGANDLYEVINGLGGDDWIDGGYGIDVMSGGTGNDTYVVDNKNDIVVENANEGTDLVQSSIIYILGDNVENLTLIGTASISGFGNAFNNTLTGNAASNWLDGGAGADTMIGGAGNDVYVVDNVGDVVAETANQGTDLVQSSITYTLGDNVENLTLTGMAPINGTGNGLDNVLTGSASDNILTGGGGNDTFDGGGGGNDIFIGGAGNDTYRVTDIAGTITFNEKPNEGYDVVMYGGYSSRYNLPDNIEKLVFEGRSMYASDVWGNDLDNVIIGRVGVRNDTYHGGKGADTYIASGGTFDVDNPGDTVVGFDAAVYITAWIDDWVLADGHYGLQLASDAAGNPVRKGTGNAGNNLLVGNGGGSYLYGLDGNDTLKGDPRDFLVGGRGDDTYYLFGEAGIPWSGRIVESAGEGRDKIISYVDCVLPDNVEDLELVVWGGLRIEASRATGNALDNTITGSGRGNTIRGGAGNDTLISRAGGHDTYVFVRGDGQDTVEDYDLTGYGTDGLYYVGDIGAADTSFSRVGDDLVVTVAGTGDSVTVRYHFSGEPDPASMRYAMEQVRYEDGTVLPASVIATRIANNNTNTTSENADLIFCGVGNDSINALGGNDLVAGGAGADSLNGGAGDDTLYGNGGNDTFLGGDGSDTLDGGAGDDIYDGGAGDDTLQAGAGADTYVLARGGGVDTVTVDYFPGEAIDTVSIAADISPAQVLVKAGGPGDYDLIISVIGDTAQMVLTQFLLNDPSVKPVQIKFADGTVWNAAWMARTATAITGTNSVDTLNGTDGGEQMFGLGGNDVLNGFGGNDTLDGGTGADKLVGGDGDDIYIVDNTGDTIAETANQGTDLVQSSVTYTLTTNVENLTLTGTAAINGTGNTLSNALTGNSANNTLSGGTGADTMIGGAGNDTYVVDNASDIVTENANEGTDLVQSSVTYMLGNNVENLTLTGTATINGTGNALDNVLVGSGAANTLTGGAGNDALNGGAGNDTMVGGTGNDVYAVDATGEVVTENANEGTDLIQVNIATAGGTYTLGSNVENAMLTGTVAYNLTGNALDNILVGNAAANTLDGGVGNDTMVGGAGNDALNGGAGNDTMVGGTGNDVYAVDATGEVVTENANEGTDLIQVNIATAGGTYTLGSNVENAMLTNTVAYDLTGNVLDNVLVGNAAANTLNGGAGNDTMVGGVGNDTMVGGTGNDTYLVDATGDVVTENANEGIDLVQVNIATASGIYTLGSNVENAMLTNTVAYDLTGNALDNVLVGNAAANTLTGNAGNDTLGGGAGADSLVGGTGNDAYILGRGYGADTVTENDATVGNTDVASFLSGIATDQIWFRHVGSDLEVSVIGTSDKLTIKSWYSGAAYHVEQFKTADNKTLLDTRVENLVTAMAAFLPPAAGQTTLPSNYQTALSPVIAANWQ